MLSVIECFTKAAKMAEIIGIMVALVISMVEMTNYIHRFPFIVSLPSRTYFLQLAVTPLTFAISSPFNLFSCFSISSAQ